MSLSDREIEKKDAAKAKKQEKVSRGLYLTKYRGGADWATVNCDMLLRAIAVVTAQHAAIQMGYTSDGGAFSIVIYDNGERLKNYIHDLSELETFLTELEQDYGK
jgi:hypothetical protein